MIVMYFNNSVIFSLCFNPKTIVKLINASVQSSILLTGTLILGVPAFIDNWLLITVNVPGVS